MKANYRNIVLVLPYINMNPPWMYMCSPSWTPLPIPSPYLPSGSGYMPSSGVAGSYSRFVPSFWRDFHTVLHNGCISLHSHQQCKRVSFSPHHFQHLLLVDFFIFYIFLKYKFIYFNWRLITLQYCIGFAIHQHESATGILVYSKFF